MRNRGSSNNSIATKRNIGPITIHNFSFFFHSRTKQNHQISIKKNTISEWNTIFPNKKSAQNFEQRCVGVFSSVQFDLKLSLCAPKRFILILFFRIHTPLRQAHPSNAFKSALFGSCRCIFHRVDEREKKLCRQFSDEMEIRWSDLFTFKLFRDHKLLYGRAFKWFSTTIAKYGQIYGERPKKCFCRLKWPCRNIWAYGV